MSVSLSGGYIHDSEPALDLFGGIELNGKNVLVDKAYSCDKIREHEAQICIPDKANFKGETRR